jgi:hypothetical protein
MTTVHIGLTDETYYPNGLTAEALGRSRTVGATEILQACETGGEEDLSPGGSSRSDFYE